MHARRIPTWMLQLSSGQIPSNLNLETRIGLSLGVLPALSIYRKHLKVIPTVSVCQNSIGDHRDTKRSQRDLARGASP